MAPAPLSQSWLVPFALGVATSCSLMWLSKMSSSSSEGQQKPPPPPAPRSRGLQSPPDAADADAVLDAPDLDNRMLRKAEAVLRWRTSRLILVIERCTNDHNYSAILRTAEALGVQHIYVIDPPPIDEDDDVIKDDRDEQQYQLDLKAARREASAQGKRVIVRTPQEREARRAHHLFAQNATEWVSIRDFDSSEACVKALRDDGYHLWVTDLSQHAVSLELDGRTDGTNAQGPTMPERVALVMGTEAVGCSQYLLDEADLRVYLPLRGFADSLNLSVATALIVHQMFIIDPSLVGAISEEEKYQLRTQWYTKLCRQRLLTSSQKKTRTKIQSQIAKCTAIQRRVQEIIAKDGTYDVQEREQSKIDELAMWQQKLADFDREHHLDDPARAQAAVQEWIDNPPAPLSDLRRADTHRVTFVGKSTKHKHTSHWKDMAATANPKSLCNATSNGFRAAMQSK